MIAECWYLAPLAVITPFTQERRHADRIIDERLIVYDPDPPTTMAEKMFSERKADQG